MAKQPQGKGQKDEAIHLGVKPIKIGMGAMLLGIVNGNGSFQVSLRLDNLPKKEQGRPQRPMGLQKEPWVLYILGQTHELLR